MLLSDLFSCDKEIVLIVEGFTAGVFDGDDFL